MLLLQKDPRRPKLLAAGGRVHLQTLRGTIQPRCLSGLLRENCEAGDGPVIAAGLTLSSLIKTRFKPEWPVLFKLEDWQRNTFSGRAGGQGRGTHAMIQALIRF